MFLAAFQICQWSDSVLNERVCPLARHLPPSELQRVASLKHDVDKARSVLGHLLLRRCVQSVSSRLWVDIVLVRDPESNRPFVKGLDVDANMSHDGAWVVSGSIVSGKIGVDVVQVKVPGYCVDTDDFLAGLEKQMGLREWRDLVETTDCAKKLWKVYVYWALKEAYLKAAGRGIVGAADMATLEFRFDIDTEPRGYLVRDVKLFIGEEKVQGWEFFVVALDNVHLVAVAHQSKTAKPTPTPQIVDFDWIRQGLPPN